MYISRYSLLIETYKKYQGTGQFPHRQLPPENYPLLITPVTIPTDNYPHANCPPDDHPGKIAPQTIERVNCWEAIVQGELS